MDSCSQDQVRGLSQSEEWRQGFLSLSQVTSYSQAELSCSFMTVGF